MDRNTKQIPVIILDGFFGTGSSDISKLMGRSYVFEIINGNKVLRELAEKSGSCNSPKNTIKHEIEVLSYYKNVFTETNRIIINELFSKLEQQALNCKKPTIIHATGFLAHTVAKELPHMAGFWLFASANDRAQRLATEFSNSNSSAELELLEKISELDIAYEKWVQDTYKLTSDNLQNSHSVYIDTTGLTIDQAFQKLATVEEFVQTYNNLAHLFPDYLHEWQRWHCMNCNLVYESRTVVTKCPRCGNDDPNRFRDVD